MTVPSGALAALMIVHVAGGTVALLAGIAAVAVRKGGRIHRKAGDVFAAAMLVMGVFADILAVIVPGQLPNFLGGSLSIYLVCTGWMTVRPRSAGIVVGERIALGFTLLLTAPLLLVSAALILGAPIPEGPDSPARGYLIVADLIFSSMVALAAWLDLRNLRAHGLKGVARVARHLWRMTAALALNAGSAFTNGLPRLLPPSVHLPAAAQFAPMLAILCVLAFWMARVRSGQTWRLQ